MPPYHLDLEDLTPSTIGTLTPEQASHLKACPKCRVEVRLLAQMATPPKESLPGLPLARRALVLTRSTLLQSFTSAHLLQEDDRPDALEDPGPILSQLPERQYDGLAPLGLGGMGEVWRVQDLRLQRSVAMKWLRGHRKENTPILDRFLQEARITAQLQHPGIVSVHEMGQLEDGRPYFTMEEVRGRTLQSLIEDLHDASREGEWGKTPEGYGLRRLISAFHRACEAVAYAHSEGVIHRDIKPNNIMIGAYGEVQVLDWGLAKVLGSIGEDATPPQDPTSPEDPTPLQATYPSNIGSNTDPIATSQGSIVGTVPYMPPEQAAGDVTGLGPTADVYALGASLYHLLSGRRPYLGSTAEVLGLLKSGPPDAVEDAARAGGVPPLPAGLSQICATAMARRSQDRYPSADALARALAEWLDGARRREEALALVAKAKSLKSALEATTAARKELEEPILALRRILPPNAPIEDKRPLWALEDDARTLEGKEATLRTRFVEAMQAALSRDPDLPEAHSALAAYYEDAHRRAEAQGRWAEAEGLAILIAEHGGDAYAPYLKGEGSLTLGSDPPGAALTLYPLKSQDRRLIRGSPRPLGTTPLQAHPLPMGSYILELTHPERAPLTYPIYIPRGGHWAAEHPEGGHPPVSLPPKGAIPADARYIPPGPFICGGDAQAPNPFPKAEVWVDGFIMMTHPVTNGEYLIFLNALVDAGESASALAHAPRERSGTSGEGGALIYQRDEQGHFALGEDEDGDQWQADWPVILITFEGALAYAQWLSQRTGQPWRLPHELEWEKAARGVDGRPFPWGHHFEVCYSANRLNPPGRRAPSPIFDHPEDISPYGIRGMAGNVGDWCANPYDPEATPPSICPTPAPLTLPVPDATPRAKRGGGWSHDGPLMRCAERHGFLPGYRSGFVGFRLVRSYP